LCFAILDFQKTLTQKKGKKFSFFGGARRAPNTQRTI